MLVNLCSKLEIHLHNNGNKKTEANSDENINTQEHEEVKADPLNMQSNMTIVNDFFLFYSLQLKVFSDSKQPTSVK